MLRIITTLVFLPTMAMAQSLDPEPSPLAGSEATPSLETNLNEQFRPKAESLDELAGRLKGISLDNRMSREVSNVRLSLPGMELSLNSGTLHAMTDYTGMIYGAIFQGEGQVTLSAPEGLESHELSETLGASPLVSGVTAAWIRTTDPEVRAALGMDKSWARGEKNHGAWVIDGQRKEMATQGLGVFDPRLNAATLWESATDSATGHIYADLRLDRAVAGPRIPNAPFKWVTYVHNPQGALFPGEPTAVFVHRERGVAPQEVFVATSFADEKNPRPESPLDLQSVTLLVEPDINVNDANIFGVTIRGTLTLAARSTPVQAAQFQLIDSIKACLGGGTDFSVVLSSMETADGRPLNVGRVGDRIIVRPELPIDQNPVTWRFELAGPLSASLTGQDKASNSYFTPLDDFAWYPRMVTPDRHATTIQLTLPEKFDGIATGKRVMERVEKGKRIIRFQENRGVRNASVMFGRFVVHTSDPEASGPQISMAGLAGDFPEPKKTLDSVSLLIKVLARFWGPFPFDSLSIGVVPLPVGNWLCPPPGDLYASEGYLTSTGGCVNQQLPYVAPDYDSKEGRDLDYLFRGTDERRTYYYLSQVAAQWFGQAMFPASYRDSWLVTGLAQLTAAMYQDVVGASPLSERLRSWQGVAKQRINMPPIVLGPRLVNHAADGILAEGPAYLYNLSWSLPGTGFIDLVRSTMNASQEGAISVQDFERLLVERLGTQDAEPLHYWLEDRKLPNITWSHTFSKGEDGLWNVSIVVDTQDQQALPFGLPIGIKLKGHVEPAMAVIFIRSLHTEQEINGLEAQPKKVIINPKKRTLLGKVSGS